MGNQRLWRERFRLAVESVLDTVVPAACAVCGRAGQPVCAACLDDVVPWPPGGCERCGGPVTGGPGTVCRSCQAVAATLPRTRTAGAFEGGLRRAIHALKYGNRPDTARSLAAILVAPAREVVGSTATVIVPVPLHSTRLEERGYNQAALLAEHLGRRTSWHVSSALERIVATPRQIGLGQRARHANLAGAIRATLRLDGMQVLVVDDVLTTGATLSEAARACRAAGAAHVVAVCLARDV